MTLDQYTTLREEHSHLKNGEFLQFFIHYLLTEKLNLTLLQDSTLATLQGGDYNPADSVMYKSTLEILQLASTENIDALLTLLKRLPKPTKNTNVKFTIDGKECSKAVYFDKDGDYSSGRWDGKSERPVRKRLGQHIDYSKFLSERAEAWDEFFSKPKPIKVFTDVPVPVADVPIAEVKEDEFGDFLAPNDESQFEFNERAEKWVNRPKGDTDAYTN